MIHQTKQARSKIRLLSVSDLAKDLDKAVDFDQVSCIARFMRLSMVWPVGNQWVH